MRYVLPILLGYLLGCSNLAYYISRYQKKDLRSGGSGNLFGYQGNLSITDSTISGDTRLEATMASATLSGTVKIGLGKSNGLSLANGIDLDISGMKESCTDNFRY